MKLSNEQLAMLAERELIRVAFHEVSHAVIYRHFGCFPEPRIWRNVGYIETSEKAWGGQCQTYTPNMLREHRKLAALAGFVGETIAITIADNESIAELQEVIAEEFLMAIDDDEISQSDMANIGDDVSATDVFEVMQLLMDRWGDVEAEAWEMIERARLLAADDESLIFSSIKNQVPIGDASAASDDLSSINKFFGAGDSD